MDTVTEIGLEPTGQTPLWALALIRVLHPDKIVLRGWVSGDAFVAVLRKITGTKSDEITVLFERQRAEEPSTVTTTDEGDASFDFNDNTKWHNALALNRLSHKLDNTVQAVKVLRGQLEVAVALCETTQTEYDEAHYNYYTQERN